MSRPRFLISAGEVSGDRIGGLISEALLARQPNLDLCGIGGPAMEAGGVRLWADTTHLGVIGLFEIIRVFPEIRPVVRLLRRRIREERPDAAILISCEGLNVPLGWYLKRQGIPTLAYFPPQVWMWRRFARFAGLFFDRILAAFPEELEVYGRSKAQVRFVGHYLRDIVEAERASSRSHDLEDRTPRIALLPGSRRYEFENYAPVLLDTALEIEGRLGRCCHFSLPLASSDFVSPAEWLIRDRQLQDRVDFRIGAPEALSGSNIGLIASGTATLEAALLGLPFILFYRLSESTIALTRLCQRLGLITDDFLGLPNLVAGRELVPEFRQKQVRPELLAEAVVDLLRDPDRQARMRAGFSEVSAILGDGRSLERIAAEALSVICMSGQNDRRTQARPEEDFEGVARPVKTPGE